MVDMVVQMVVLVFNDRLLNDGRRLSDQSTAVRRNVGVVVVIDVCGSNNAVGVFE